MLLAFGIFLLAACSQTKNANGPLSSVKVKGNVVTYNIVAQKTMQEVKPGVTKEVWTFGGTMPGKEIRVKEGQEVYINIKNSLSVPISMHWHGLKVPYVMDGVPGVSQNNINPGKSFTYHFIANQPGTYWYHSHQDSANELDRGLYGSFIVEGKNEVKTDKEYNLMVDEIYSKDPDPNVKATTPPPKEGTGTPYDIFILNGKSESLIQPISANTGEKVRLRLTNAGYEVHKFDFSNIPYQVIATDGHELQDPGTVQNQLLNVGAGERYDVVFTMPGKSFKIYDRSPFAPAKDVVLNVNNPLKKEFLPEVVNTTSLNILAYGKPDSVGTPTYNQVYTWTIEDKVDPTSELGGIRYTINGKDFPEINPLVVANGDLVKITIDNKGAGIHPMHLHGHVFRVLSRNGVPVQSDIEKDTLTVNPGEKYDISFVADNPGEWPFHCHDLPHAKAGMMATIQYTYQVPKGIDRGQLSE